MPNMGFASRYLTNDNRLTADDDHLMANDNRLMADVNRHLTDNHRQRGNICDYCANYLKKRGMID